MKALVTYNPKSGTQRITKNQEVVKKCLEEAGYEVEMFPSPAPKSITEYIKNNGNNYDLILTSGGDGGNTYLCKSDKEIELIKNKISKANKGINNGQSKQIKAYNVNTKEIIHFDTLHNACIYFNIQNGPFTKYCNHKAICLWKNEWTFAYEGDEFFYDLPIKYDKSCNKGTKVKLINLNDNSEIIFNSLNKLNKYLGISKGKLKYINNECNYLNYKIIKLNIK